MMRPATNHFETRMFGPDLVLSRTLAQRLRPPVTTTFVSEWFRSPWADHHSTDLCRWAELQKSLQAHEWIVAVEPHPCLSTAPNSPLPPARHRVDHWAVAGFVIDEQDSVGWSPTATAPVLQVSNTIISIVRRWKSDDQQCLSGRRLHVDPFCGQSIPIVRASTVSRAIAHGATTEADRTIAADWVLTSAEFVAVVARVCGVELVHAAPRVDDPYDMELATALSRFRYQATGSVPHPKVRSGSRSEPERDAAMYSAVACAAGLPTNARPPSPPAPASPITVQTTRDDRSADGSELHFVLVNAVGQDGAVWAPLVDHLAESASVTTIQVEGRKHGDDVWTFDDHLQALDEALDGLDGPAHFVGWCGSAKLATRVAQRSPANVHSVALIGPSFKQPDRPTAFDSAYERDLESVVRLVARRPAAAARLHRLFGDAAVRPGEPSEQHSYTPAAQAMTASTPSPELADHLRVPFADAESFVAFAVQSVAYWGEPPVLGGERLALPTMIVRGQADHVVTTEGIQWEADRSLTCDRFEQPPGWNHYPHFEHPRAVARMLMSFALDHTPTKELSR